MFKFPTKLSKARVQQTFKNFYYGLNLLRHLSKKQFILIFSAIFFMALLFPNYYAKAEPITLGIGAILLIGAATSIIGGIVGAAIGKLGTAITFVSLIIGAASATLFFGFEHLKIGSAMLAWAIDRPFGVSLTNPTSNFIIKIGWTVLRDLTNMFFILGLAYIGLATALNLSGFNTKKTFARLIIFALLINFTPVICGVIVDATNIISNFFLSSVSFSALTKVYGNVYHTGTGNIGFFKVLWDTLWNEPTWMQFIMLTIYAAIAGTILWLFALLFLLRNFIIWLLVILSPLAFFAGIFDFPKAKAIYKKWWSALISWSVIAIPAGFFLYLASHLLAATLEGATLGNLHASGNVLQKFFMGFMPYFVVIFFMCIGFYLTLKINAMGSGIIIGAANRTLKKTIALPKTIGAKLRKATDDVAKGVGAGAGVLVGASMLGGGAFKGGKTRIKQNYAQRRAEGQGVIGSALKSLAKAPNQENIIAGQKRKAGVEYDLRLKGEDLGILPQGTAALKKTKASVVASESKRLKNVKGEKDLNRIIEKENVVMSDEAMATKLAAIQRKIAENHTITDKDIEIAKKAEHVDGGATLKAMAKKNAALTVATQYEKAKDKQVENILNGDPLQQERLEDLSSTEAQIDLEKEETEKARKEKEAEATGVERDLKDTSLSDAEKAALNKKKEVLEKEIEQYEKQEELLEKSKELIEQEKDTITKYLEELEDARITTRTEAEILMDERKEAARIQEINNALREQEIARLIKSANGAEKSIKTRADAMEYLKTSGITDAALAAKASKEDMAKAEKTANVKIMTNAPEIDRAIKMEMIQEQFDKMKAADARATQVTDTNIFLGMEKAHANALRKAPLKTRKELDNLLTKEDTRAKLAVEGALLEAKRTNINNKLKAIKGDKTKTEERNELRQKLNEVTAALKRFSGVISTISNSREFQTGGEGTGNYADEADDKKAEASTSSTATTAKT